MPSFQSTVYPDSKKPVTLLKCDQEDAKVDLDVPTFQRKGYKISDEIRYAMSVINPSYKSPHIYDIHPDTCPYCGSIHDGSCIKPFNL